MIDPRDVIAYSRFFMFGPWCRGESALTMTSADVWWSIPSPPNGGSTVVDHQTSQGKTRDFPPIYPPHLLPHLPGSYWDSSFMALSSRCDSLVCDFCSSGREFASSFLQTPPRDGRPCCLANGSRYQGSVGDFHHRVIPRHHPREQRQSGAARHACRTTQKTPASAGVKR
jgi:hypothetical protein